MSDTRRIWRSRGWVGGFVLALVASVLPIAQQIGTVDAAPGDWVATALDPVALTPIDDGTVTLESGSATGPAFRYAYSLPGGGVPERAWGFSTSSTTLAQVTIPYTYTGFHAYFQVYARLRAFVTHDGSTSYVDLVNAGPTNCCTTPSGGFSYEGSHTFSVAPGDAYGFITSGSNFDSNATLQGRLALGTATTVVVAPFVAPTEVAQNTSWSTAAPLSDSAQGTLAQPGETRWYKFPVTPDSQVQVTLAGLAANFDLAIYRDIEQAFQQLTSPSDLARLGAQFAADAYAPSIYSPSIYSPSIYSPSIYSPSIYSPSIYSANPTAADQAFLEAFTGAQTRSLITVSALEGTAPETIRTATWNNTGNFYVRVSGRNGASSPTPFSLSLDRENGPCSSIAIDTHSGDATISGLPAGKQTIILTDTTRFETTLGSDYLASLNALAARTNGVVVDVSQSTRVRALNDQADATTSCAYLKNLVADAIRDIVVAYRASSPGVQYVVIAGGDSVIPFFRYADGAGLGPESDYIPPLESTTSSDAALRSNSVLGQDAYGSTVDLALQGSELPVPDLPVGRLVETPAQVVGQVNAYLADGGDRLRPASSLVTGYDFLTSAADEVQKDFSAGVGAANAATLITDQGIPTTLTSGPTTSRTLSWTADNLRAALAAPRDAYFIAGHFSANSTLAADYSTSVTTSEFVAANTFGDSLVISPGCHSGFNIPDEDGIPTLTDGLDWAQLMAEQHATLIAGTGYQYADTDFLAYSAKLYTMITEELRVGQAGTPVAVGTALMEAKRQYLEQTPSLSGIDKKSLIQATLYGLPMKGIDFGAGRIPAATPTTGGIPVSPVVAGTPGDDLGLKTADRNLTLSTTTQNRQILDLSGNPIPGASFSWLVGPAGVQTAPAVPALPKQIDDVTSATGEILRGVGFRSGSYADTTGVRPLTGAPATEQNGVHTDFTSPVFWPQRLANVNYYDQIGESADGRTRLVTTPAQYRAEGSGVTNTQRAYSALGLRLFYSSNTTTYDDSTPALAAPPSISQVSGSTAGSSVDVSAVVTGDPSAGIQEVWVTYTAESGPLHGSWQSANLAQDPTVSTDWAGSFPLPAGQDPTAVRFMVQAANGVGLVGLDNNLGTYYTPNVRVGVSPPATATATSVALAPGTPAGAEVGSSITVSAVLTGPPAGSIVTFGVGTATRSASTDAGGVASVVIPVQGSIGSSQVTAAYAGTDAFAASSTAAPFTVSQVPTTLALATSSADKVAGGIATGVTATLVRTSGIVPIGQQPVEFTVLAGADGSGGLLSRRNVTTDPNGVASLGVLRLSSGSYRIEARFGGTPTTFLGANATPATLVVAVSGPSILVTRSPGANDAGWNSSAVSVTFACADVVGVLSCLTTPAPTLTQEVNTDGDTTLTATATDVLGNVSTQQVLVRIDRVPPTLSGAPTTAPNAAGWYRGDVVVRWTCGDVGSGIVGGVCPADSTITGEGVDQDAGADVTDVAGNPTVAKSTPAVKIDRTAPASTAAVQPATTSQVSVRIDADDALSGIAGITYQVDAGLPVTVTHASGTLDPFVQFVVTGAGPHTVRYWSRDVAGNEEAPKTLNLTIDAAPDIRWALSPAPNRRGWNNTNTTVTFTCVPKGTSVIATCTSPVTVTTEGKAQPVIGTAATTTGVTATETAYVSLDKTAPTISARASGQPNAAGWYDHPVNVQFKCTDALSGVRSCSDDVTLKSDGVRTLTGSATDAADNTSTTTFGPIRVDRTDPVVRIVGLVNGSTYDFTAMPNVSCTTTDALSGVAVPATLTLRYDGPMVKVRCSGATDVAGNEASTVSAVFRVRNALEGVSAAVRTYVLGSSASNKTVVAGNLVRLLRDGKIDRFVTDVRAQVGLTLTSAQAEQLVLWSGLLDDDDDHDDDDDDHDDD